MLKLIKNLKTIQTKKQWFETYWAFDLHGTIIKSNHKNDGVAEYYPFVKKTLQLLSKREDVVLILFTSSYPKQIKLYLSQFKRDGIKFKYINENPEINKSNFGFYEGKFYFDLLFENKAGFETQEWKGIFSHLKNDTWRPKKEWKRK